MAQRCNTSQPRIWQCLHRNLRVPAELVLPIEAATGVSRHELRPDLYPAGCADLESILTSESSLCQCVDSAVNSSSAVAEQ
ncbi:TPA: transcriptional regulator [Pseudomonas aeruginosa]